MKKFAIGTLKFVGVAVAAAAVVVVSERTGTTEAILGWFDKK